VDGYYALSSVLDLQDLREGSFRFLGTWFQKHILRLPVEVPVMTRRRKRISVVYGLLAMTYTASIMVLVGKLFNNLYTSYFPDIATALLIVTLFYIFRKRLRNVGRVGKLFYLDKKELFMSPKSRVPLAVAGGIVLLALLLPWSHRTISAESTLQPARTARLEAPDDAVISEVLVHEGDLVQRGQPIFRLSSASIDEETARLISEQQRFATASARGLAANDATLVFKSQRNASAVLASSRSVDVRRRDLVVRSPIQGRVLTPRTQDLVGRNVAKGSALAQIGDCRRMGAEINVTERLLEYLHPGARVTAQVRTRPMKTEVGMIARISAATLEQPKTSVGGEEPVAPHALPDRFVALASFDNPDGTLLPGAAVRVKIRSNREAYLVRVWSVLWRWLRSVVW
jgi:multidrug efflux pump subunit AcrA (membrane-fusion protein)